MRALLPASSFATLASPFLRAQPWRLVRRLVGYLAEARERVWTDSFINVASRIASLREQPQPSSKL